ncbi:MAG: hypothetical protein RB191_16135 [Terriglobia bacterium]|nr:hypothetical protein [Terriglobia bacterium]
MTKYFFILGARDPEMIEVERVLEEMNVPYTVATVPKREVVHGEDEDGRPYTYTAIRQRRVHSRNAYRAIAVRGLIPRGYRLVFVECAVTGLLADEVCDHHNEGDPGYGIPPERYLEGSSLGQVLALLGLEATPQQRIIAAADHCLRHAYEGKCPGVTPEALAAWRESDRANAREISVEEMRARIELGKQALLAAPRICVGGESVAWFPHGEEMPDEVAEASARLGIPFCYAEKRPGNRGKAGIMSAPPAVVEAWMRQCQLQDIYGCPQRGFAGGYLESAR